ncbi:phosphopantetheine-binding protein [Clostridium paraputrificum]|uniref:phosphopantetheine-binding protein n=1 Tax=Clostridium paraputrificum TaxID=29363 RepID=UPI003D347366
MEIEKTLEEIWMDILKVDSIDYDTSFYVLGADSISLVKCSNLVIQKIGVIIEIIDLFDHDTIKSLTKFIRTKM